MDGQELGLGGEGGEAAALAWLEAEVWDLLVLQRADTTVLEPGSWHHHKGTLASLQSLAWFGHGAEPPRSWRMGRGLETAPRGCGHLRASPVPLAW